jgi:nicotinamidase-related amidase
MGADTRARAGGGRLDRDQSLLLIVDVQARLAPHVLGHDALVARADALLDAARRLGVPCMVTEHCPDDLGPVIPSLRERFAPGEIFVKTRFGAAEHPEFVSLLRERARRQVVVAGMEAHVCVMQTVLGLATRGFETYVAGDAVGSRGARQADRRFALERMARGGALLAGTETLLFEWLRAGDDPAFRDVLARIKNLPAQPGEGLA